MTVPFSEMPLDEIRGCPTLKECLKRAIETNDVSCVRDVVTGSYGELQDKSDWLRDAFIGAAQYGHTDLVDVLLDGGAHIMTVDQYGHSAFITAVKEGHVKFVEKLIILGFPVSNHRDGIEALYCACNNVRVNMLKLLLAHTSDEQVNANIDLVGFTFLGWSIMMDKPRKKEIVRLLLEAGANVNQLKGGCTALHLAVGISDLKIVKLLLEANADVNIKNASGKNAFWVANLQRLDILILLLQYGADPTPGKYSHIKFCLKIREDKQPYVHLRIQVQYSLALKLLYSACSNNAMRSIEEWLKTKCTIPEMLVVLDEFTCTPRSLQSACRLAVRRAMNMKRPDDVNGLSLPQRLKEYLLLSDIQASLKQAEDVSLNF